MSAPPCHICHGHGEIGVPDDRGRVFFWSRSAICTTCLGTGKELCHRCGERPCADEPDAEGELSCEVCAAEVLADHEASGESGGLQEVRTPVAAEAFTGESELEWLRRRSG